MQDTVTKSQGKPMMWVAVAVLVGLGVCVVCAISYFILSEVNASVKQSALDEQCFFDDTSHTDAECDAWVQQVTTQHRAEFMECASLGTAEAVYQCLVDKGLGP